MHPAALLLVALAAVGCASPEPAADPDWTPVAEARSANAEGTAPTLQLYDVRDLVPRADGDAGFDRFIADLRRNVSPDSWADSDDVMVRAQSGALIVKQRPAVHGAIATYLDDLRRAALATR